MGCRTKVYIAGGIGALSPEAVTNYFESVGKKFEELGIEVLSPIRGKVLDVGEINAGGEYCRKYEAKEIVLRDEHDIDKADFIIAMPSDHSIGTFMEIYRASRMRHIPVIVVTDNPRIASHYWIKECAFKILPTVDEAVDYIKAWLL